MSERRDAYINNLKAKLVEWDLKEGLSILKTEFQKGYKEGLKEESKRGKR
jgi:hypothetical protein